MLSKMVLLSTCFILMLAIMLVFYYVTNLNNKLKQDLAWLSNEYQYLLQKISATERSVILIEQNLNQLEQKIDVVHIEKNQITNTRNINPQIYAQATKMVAKGCSADELIETLGVTKAEATLIIKLRHMEESVD